MHFLSHHFWFVSRLFFLNEWKQNKLCCSQQCDKFGVNYWFWTSKAASTVIFCQWIHTVNIYHGSILIWLSLWKIKCWHLSSAWAGTSTGSLRWFAWNDEIRLHILRYEMLHLWMKNGFMWQEKHTSRHVNTDIRWLHWLYLARLHIYFISWLIANQIERFFFGRRHTLWIYLNHGNSQFIHQLLSS